MTQNNSYLASKPRYEILDGLRGVAAIMVVIFHVCQFFTPKGVQQPVNHGYLAVDFFFLLSGFVIGYAYDDRWDKMSIWGFFKRRLVRLHPLVVFQTFMGFFLFLLVSEAFPNAYESSLGLLLLSLVMALFMIPHTPALDARGWLEINIFVDTSWSLTYEYIANILYAIILRHLPKVVLFICCMIAIIPLLDMTMGWDLFGFFPDPQYNLKGGWTISPNHIYLGFTRLTFPFLCGMLISRSLSSKDGIKSDFSLFNIHFTLPQVPGGFWLASALIVAILCVPCIGGVDGVANGLYQVISIVVVFPLIILLGAGSMTTDNRSTKICKFLGELSYPLYITHFQLSFLQMAFFKSHPDVALWQMIYIGIGIVVVSIVVAYAFLRTYDEPMRKWLTDNWLKRK